MGAIVTDKRGKVLGFGYNSMKTHKLSDTWHKRTHAELKAILSARSRMGYKGMNKADSIYIFRQGYDSTLLCAAPCRACLNLIRDSGIKNVYFTDNGGYSCFTL